MKTLCLILTLSAPVAAADFLSVPGLADLVAQKAKESRAVATLDLRGRKGAGAYLPVWTLKSAGENPVRYAFIGAGWEGSDLGGRPLVPLGLNLPALSGRLWSSPWAQAHIERAVFPPVWFGPHFRVPLPQDRFQWKNIKDFLGFMLSVGVG